MTSLSCVETLATLTHHYITKRQAAYLWRAKKILQENGIIVFLDFAHFSFIIPDAIQGHHCNNAMATIHHTPYFLEEGTLRNESFCVISNSVDHNTLYAFNRQIIQYIHDDVIKWKHFPRYWSFVRGIHRSPVNSPHKGQRHGAFMFSLICARINGWVNNGEAGDLRRIRPHYDVTVMQMKSINTVLRWWCWQSV